jgi:hypothetical protein
MVATSDKNGIEVGKLGEATTRFQHSVRQQEEGKTYG